MSSAEKMGWGVYVDGQEEQGPLLIVDVHHLAFSLLDQVAIHTCLDVEDLFVRRVRVQEVTIVENQAKDDPEACRKCGCTEDRACEDGCWWVIRPSPKRRGLCSACAPRRKAPARKKGRAS